MPEAFAVLGLLGFLLTSIVSATGPMLGTLRVESAASEVAAALRSARLRALLDGRRVVVAFDVAGGRYEVPAGAAAARTEAEALPDGATRRIARLPRGVRFTRPDPGAAVTLAVPATSDCAALFDGRGLLLSATLPGLVYLGDPQRGLYRRVRVNSIGAVTIERWDGSAWR